jgi:hypothetical protein
MAGKLKLRNILSRQVIQIAVLGSIAKKKMPLGNSIVT